MAADRAPWPASVLAPHPDRCCLVAIEGDGRAERLIVERTRPIGDGQVEGTGETYAIEAGLVVSCIGYQTPPIPGVPYEHGRGRFASDEGRVLPGLYAVGWARRGPSGTIGTTRLPSCLSLSRMLRRAPPLTSTMARRGRPSLRSR